MCYTYILKSERSGRYYIGSTSDLVRRLEDHHAGNTPSTRNKGPWLVVHVEEFATLGEARHREAQIKGWKSRSYMERVLCLAREPDA